MAHQIRYPLSSRLSRRHMVVLCAAPLLNACASDWHELRPEGHVQLPFLGGYPTTVMRRSYDLGAVTGHLSDLRLEQVSEEKRSLAWDALREAGMPLLDKAAALGLIRYRKDDKGFNAPLDKRLFLVSVQPDILVVVPHTYPPLPATAKPDPRYPLSLPVWQQFIALRKAHRHEFGEPMHEAFSADKNDAQVATVEVSSSFPDVPGIAAVSAKWEGARTLAQMDSEHSLPFVTSVNGGLPGYRRLVRK